MQGNACFAAIGRVRACSFSTSGLLSHRNWCGRQNRQQRRPLDRCLRSCLHASVGRGRSCLSWRHSNRACSAATTYAALLCCCPMLLCYAAMLCCCCPIMLLCRLLSTLRMSQCLSHAHTCFSLLTFHVGIIGWYSIKEVTSLFKPKNI